MENNSSELGRSHAVLLLHGLAGSSLEMSRLGQILQAAGFKVFAPDIPGFAYGTAFSHWQTWVDFVRTQLEDLQTRHETVSVAGISQGATLALELATLKNPTALVLLSVGFGYDGWSVPWYRFLLRWAKLIPFHDRYRYVEREPFGVKNPALRAVVKKMLAERSQSVVGGESISLDQLLEGDALIKRVRGRVDLVSSPVLLIHPVEDEAVHPRNAQYIYDHVSSSDKEIIFLGDCYHMITVDNERDTVFYETEMFLKRAVNKKTGRSVFDIPAQPTRSLDKLAKWARAA
jgi:carboxylesterase